MSFGHGGPGWGPGGNGNSSPTPDWAALAEASEARNRRRRLLMVGGGALATVAVGATVAFLIVSADSGSGTDTAQKPPALPEDTSTTGPSFESTTPPPLPSPTEFIATEKRDTAPLSANSLFPGKELTVGDRVYKKGATSDTKKCDGPTTDGLGKLLVSHDCDKLMRVTYGNDKTAITVGVAVFKDVETARKAFKATKGSISPLDGKGINGFCEAGVVCRHASNFYGRYAYFTSAGFTDAKPVKKTSKSVYQLGKDVEDFTAAQIHRRGQAAASEYANSPTE